MAPLIIAEKRIILFLISFILGIICLHQFDYIGVLGKPLLHSASAVFKSLLPSQSSMSGYVSKRGQALFWVR